MLAPRISLSQLLWSMVAVAMFLAMVSTAWRGNLVTFGQSVAIAMLPMLFLIYAIAYWVLYAIATWFDWRTSESRNPRHGSSGSDPANEVLEPTQ